MYADTVEKLADATAKLKSESHIAFVARVEAFLARQEEWVLLFRAGVATRGHNTNNFAEATIRVLKDIVLNRTEAFNVVALVDTVAVVWERYFESRILRHANNRAYHHRLGYKRLLSKMPERAAESIEQIGPQLYAVPSATHQGVTYEVYAHFGACSCATGKQGAFCKHQALVHKKFGGLFPNAPPLSTDDRHRLGKLALGDTCPSREFFQPFRREQQLPEHDADSSTTPESLHTEASSVVDVPQPSSSLAPIVRETDPAQLAQVSMCSVSILSTKKKSICLFLFVNMWNPNFRETRFADMTRHHPVQLSVVCIYGSLTLVHPSLLLVRAAKI